MTETKQVNVRVPIEVWRAVRERAFAREESVQDWAVRAFRMALAQAMGSDAGPPVSPPSRAGHPPEEAQGGLGVKTPAPVSGNPRMTGKLTGLVEPALGIDPVNPKTPFVQRDIPRTAVLEDDGRVVPEEVLRGSVPHGTWEVCRCGHTALHHADRTGRCEHPRCYPNGCRKYQKAE